MSDSNSKPSWWTSILQRLYSIQAVLLNIPGRRVDQAFILLLLLIVGGQLVISGRYSSEGQLFVIAIGVPTFLILGLLLLSRISPQVNRIMEKFASNIFTMESQVSNISSNSEEIDSTVARLQIFRISAWIITITLLIVVLGFLPAILIFMIAFYRIETDLGIKRSVGYALIIWSSIFIIFVELLETRFNSSIFGVISGLF